MGFIIGYSTPAQSITDGTAKSFDVPQLASALAPPADARVGARYRAAVIMCPGGLAQSYNQGDPEICRYAFDADATSSSPLYDTTLGMPIAVPVDAKTISVYNAATSGLSYSVHFGDVR